MDCRCENRFKNNNVGEFRVTPVPQDRTSGLDPFFFQKKKKHEWSPLKHQPFSHKMDLNIPRWSLGLKLANAKRGCKVAALYSFVRQIPPIAIKYTVALNRCFFSFLSQSTFFHLVQKSIGVWRCHVCRGHWKTSFFSSTVYGLYVWVVPNKQVQFIELSVYCKSRVCKNALFHFRTKNAHLKV